MGSDNVDVKMLPLRLVLPETCPPSAANILRLRLSELSRCIENRIRSLALSLLGLKSFLSQRAKNTVRASAKILQGQGGVGGREHKGYNRGQQRWDGASSSFDLGGVHRRRPAVAQAGENPAVAGDGPVEREASAEAPDPQRRSPDPPQRLLPPVRLLRREKASFHVRWLRFRTYVQGQ